MELCHSMKSRKSLEAMRQDAGRRSVIRARRWAYSQCFKEKYVRRFQICPDLYVGQQQRQEDLPEILTRLSEVDSSDRSRVHVPVVLPAENVNEIHDSTLSFGNRVSDAIAIGMGSWPFIIFQSIIVLLWVVLNCVAWFAHWDIYPFILLNLLFSTQAAYAAPIIMMSQNRQAQKDRIIAQQDYEIDKRNVANIEAMIEHLNSQDAVMLQLLRKLNDQDEMMMQQHEDLLKKVDGVLNYLHR
jgi:uncharacterized membrane protein